MIYILVNKNQLGIRSVNFECHKLADAEGLKGVGQSKESTSGQQRVRCGGPVGVLI